MKHIAFAALFAASLAAQNPVVKTAPELSEQMRSIKLELASAIAVEEQEKDLIKAQGLYRVAMDDKKLSAEARLFARYRLVALLRRLGDNKEAKAVLKAGGKGVVVSLDDVTNGRVNHQDPEREKQLRLQAREALGRINSNNRDATAVVEKLTWIGAPAVSEVVMYMQPRTKKWSSVAGGNELLRFLWREGGARAAAFLAESATSSMNVAVARAAAARAGIDIEAPEVRAFLDHEEWPVTRNFLTVTGKSYDAEELLTLADRGRGEMKAYALSMLPRRTLTAKQRQRAHAMCRAAVNGTNPEYGKAAELFLTSSQSQQSLDGMQMLLDLVPDLHRRKVPIATFHLPSPSGTIGREFTKVEVETLLPMVRAAVDKIGPVKSKTPAVGWLQQLLHMFTQPGGEPALQLALSMWDMGYGVPYVFDGQCSPSLAKKLLKRWAKVPKNDRSNFLRRFDNVELSSDTLPLLREIGNELAASNQPGERSAFKRVVYLVGETGHDDAADWLIAEWRKHAGSSRRNSAYTPIVWAMIELGKKNQSQRVRRAMGDMVRGFGGPKLALDDRSRLLLAMLSMGDERALDYVAAGVSVRAVDHPYGSGNATRTYAPLNYVMFKDPKPAHGYSRKQILKTVSRYAQRVSGNGGLDPARASLASIPDDVLAVLATEELSNYAQCWSQKLVRRLNDKISKGEDFAVLEKCYLASLGAPGRSKRWVASSTEAVTARYRKQLTALIEGDDAGWAMSAIEMLMTQDGRVDAVALLHNKHAPVREWAVREVEYGQVKVAPATVVPLLRDPSAYVRATIARYFGAIVHKEAVPGLIEQLRDTDENVRKVAAESLTRIRFYHEQQAHWDRVLKGLDASPASAAEKLLVQAKPEASKEQRLLAIKSLGVLGVPEALPFLIDWTQDADKDIRDAAKAAITKIHLSPRK